MSLPRLPVTVGEPAGVGPEICLRLLERPRPAAPGSSSWPICRCSPKERRRCICRAACATGPVAAAAAERSTSFICRWPPRPIPVVSIPPTRRQVLALLDRALAGCQSGEFAAMVTAPVHKGVINDAGVPFSGHTEYLAERTGTLGW
jgi:4-hydroxythreonine-4-phosphate dehydrogenase